MSDTRNGTVSQSIRLLRARSVLTLCVIGLTGVLTAADTRVFWCLGPNAKAIHRFNVTNVGETNETWTETAPLLTLDTAAGIHDVIPAHGGYYVCYGGGAVKRYTKEGVWERDVGTLSGADAFEISDDGAFIYGADMALAKGRNKIGRLRLGDGHYTIVVTNEISQVRCLTWGRDGLLYAASRSEGSGVDYWGNAISAGPYRGIQAFDVSNGGGAVLKHYYRTGSSKGGCALVPENNRLYNFSINKVCIFGRSESAVDGETTRLFRASPPVSLNNPFAGQTIAGRAYIADWNDKTPDNLQLYRFNADDTATLITNITRDAAVADGVDYNSMSQVHCIREDVFPENDTTEALTHLTDYWSFNTAETPETMNDVFSSQLNPKRWANLTSGFTAAVRGAVREGLWCIPGAKGTLTSAILIPQTADMTITFFLGFPQALSGQQILLKNPKMTVSVTADGKLAVSLPDGNDSAGNPTTGTSVTGTTSLADGAWHHAAIVRRETRFEIWVDGVKEAESDESTVAIYDDMNTQWSLLDTANANTMFFDELRVYDQALAQNDIRLLKSLATDNLTVPRDPTCRSDERARAIGTVVAHAEPDDHAWGVPAVMTDPGGTLYLAADYDRDLGENNQSVFWKSTDGGDTWTRVGSDASVGAVALFRFGTDGAGTIRAAGIEPNNNIAWGFSSTDGCSNWGTQYMQSETPVVSKWYPTFAAAGFMRNLVTTGGIYNINVGVTDNGQQSNLTSAFYNQYNHSLRPGGILNDGVRPVAFYAACTRNHAAATNTAPVEAAMLARRESENGNLSYRGSILMRGGSRPFGLTQDTETGYYWAVTTYAKDSTTPWAQANRLALYCATNVNSWIWCGDLVEAGTPETVGFNNPNVAIRGDDLVVVFGASVNDTTLDASARDVNTSNYILSKRVENFRSLMPKEKAKGRFLLVSEDACGRIIRLRENEETGEWRTDGYFANGLYTDLNYSIGSASDIKYHNGKVWILVNGRIFAFTTDGVFTGTYFDLNALPGKPAVMCFSYDGRYIYSTAELIKGGADAEVRYVYRTDTTTGTTVTFCTSADSSELNTYLATIRALVGLPDGRVLFSNRNSSFLFTVNPDGTFDQVIYKEHQYQALYLDRRAQKVYASGFSRNLLCWDLKTNTFKLKGGLPDIIGMTGDNRGRIFGNGYSEPAGIFDLLADNGALTLYGHRTIYNAGRTMFRGCAFFDTTPPDGTILTFR